MISAFFAFLSMIITVLTPIISFILSVIGKVIVKLTPIILHELWQILVFLFHSALSAATAVHDAPSITKARQAVITDAKELFIGLDAREKTALGIAASFLVGAFIYFIH